jgi:hypothetical protein
MRVRVQEIGKGFHPSEVVVKIETVQGPQEMLLDKRSLSGSTIEIGYPIAQKDNYRLIELPVETSGGSWRVWVDNKNITLDDLEAAE